MPVLILNVWIFWYWHTAVFGEERLCSYSLQWLLSSWCNSCYCKIHNILLQIIVHISVICFMIAFSVGYRPCGEWKLSYGWAAYQSVRVPYSRWGQFFVIYIEFNQEELIIKRLILQPLHPKVFYLIYFL